MTINYLMFNEFDEHFIQLLSSSNTKSLIYFDNNLVLENFINDKKKNVLLNADFYFRVFCYMKWRSLLN